MKSINRPVEIITEREKIINKNNKYMRTQLNYKLSLKYKFSDNSLYADNL